MRENNINVAFQDVNIWWYTFIKNWHWKLMVKTNEYFENCEIVERDWKKYIKTENKEIEFVIKNTINDFRKMFESYTLEKIINDWILDAFLSWVKPLESWKYSINWMKDVADLVNKYFVFSEELDNIIMNKYYESHINGFLWKTDVNIENIDYCYEKINSYIWNHFLPSDIVVSRAVWKDHIWKFTEDNNRLLSRRSIGDEWLKTTARLFEKWKKDRVIIKTTLWELRKYGSPYPDINWWWHINAIEVKHFLNDYSDIKYTIVE